MKEDNDFDSANEKTQALRDKYGRAELPNDALKVLHYYQDLIALAQDGPITSKDAAYLIADTMWYPAVDKHPGLEAITGDAGELELPNGHISGDPAGRYKRLSVWIQEEIDIINKAKGK